MASNKLNSPPAYSLEQMQMERNRQMKKMLDAWTSGANRPRIMPGEIGEYIREKIKQHEEMIEALQWFASHLSLDSPTGPLVSEVLIRGLDQMAADERKYAAEAAAAAAVRDDYHQYNQIANLAAQAKPWK